MPSFQTAVWFWVIQAFQWPQYLISHIGLLTNCGPLSVYILRGIPVLLKTSTNPSATISALTSFNGIASGYLAPKHIADKINLCPLLAFGNGPTKSSAMHSKGSVRTGSGCIGTLHLNCFPHFWQLGHAVQNRLTSLHRFSQVKDLLIMARVFLNDKWPAKGVEWAKFKTWALKDLGRTTGANGSPRSLASLFFNIPPSQQNFCSPLSAFCLHSFNVSSNLVSSITLSRFDLPSAISGTGHSWFCFCYLPL